ncbi:MarR family transcriptional regulator [Rasiella rasia]|uniref:MarR family transcriptional regulator n=1 Tax=Rasiella rasia TaxID=2744027 RepID=A0A6G6GKK9_9FLAO|nr:MarR family transcriptional regulator [Rasiella rasia]QIE59126.1 MarR family transcriptional regulator [Rasiella rasia]
MRIEEEIKATGVMELAAKTVINIAYTSRSLEEPFKTFLKEYDLSTQQFNVLRILRGQRGKPANLSTLQERMIDRNSNTTRLVDKLLKKGWVVRQVCANNRRKIEIFITEDGLQLLKTLDPIVTEKNKRSVSNLTKTELGTLNTLLDKLRS